MTMTYDERIKFYGKVGNSVTEVFKKKFPNLCKVRLYEKKPVVVRDVEFLHDVILYVHTLKDKTFSDLTDLYEIDKFIRDYFGIRTTDRHRVRDNKCSD